MNISPARKDRSNRAIGRTNSYKLRSIITGLKKKKYIFPTGETDVAQSNSNNNVYSNKIIE